MKRISEVLGKNIISIYEGKSIGIIENVVFDKKLKKLKSFVVYDEDNDNIDRLFVPSGAIKLEGENAVMIKNLEKVVEDTKNLLSKNNPINASAYNLSGNLLGKVKEVLISDDTKEIYSLILGDDTEILQEQIVSSDFKTIVIKALGEESPILSAPKRKPRPKEAGLNETVSKSASNQILNETEVKKTPKVKETEVVIKAFKSEKEPDNFETLNYSDFKEDDQKFLYFEKEDDIQKDNLSKKTGHLKDDTAKEFVAENEKIVPLNLRKFSANFGFLIGRRVEYDVYNGRNEKIVKRNTIITNTTLDICKKWGKLIILARNSVR